MLRGESVMSARSVLSVLRECWEVSAVCVLEHGKVSVERCVAVFTHFSMLR